MSHKGGAYLPLPRLLFSFPLSMCLFLGQRRKPRENTRNRFAAGRVGSPAALKKGPIFRPQAERNLRTHTRNNSYKKRDEGFTLDISSSSGREILENDASGGQKWGAYLLLL